MPAAIVQANQNFYDPDNAGIAAGRGVLSLDRKALERPGLLDEIAQDLARLEHADRTQLAPEHAAVSLRLFHEMGPIESLPIPSDLTRGLAECQMLCVTLAPGDDEHEERPWALALQSPRSPLGVSMIPRTLQLPECRGSRPSCGAGSCASPAPPVSDGPWGPRGDGQGAPDSNRE